MVHAGQTSVDEAILLTRIVCMRINIVSIPFMLAIASTFFTSLVLLENVGVALDCLFWHDMTRQSFDCATIAHMAC